MATDVIAAIAAFQVKALKVCARAERESQDRQNKYSHHLGVRAGQLHAIGTDSRDRHCIAVEGHRLLPGFVGSWKRPPNEPMTPSLAMSICELRMANRC